MPQHVWRVGHRSSPLNFVPRDRRLYAHRFDDPRSVYGTIYCAERHITCVRERLADLRPSVSFQTEFAQHLGGASPYIAAGFMSWRLRQENVDDIPELLQVASDFRLVLERVEITGLATD